VAAARPRPEPLSRRTWLLVLLAFVLFWAWVLVAQQRIEAQHPAGTTQGLGFFQPASITAGG